MTDIRLPDNALSEQTRLYFVCTCGASYPSFTELVDHIRQVHFTPLAPQPLGATNDPV